MIRQTSRTAYNKIRDAGLLSERRWEVYDVVFRHGPLTSAEAFLILSQGQRSRALTQSRARFTELRDMGLLQELGTKRCSITGRNVILWDATDGLPKPIIKKRVLPAKERGVDGEIIWTAKDGAIVWFNGKKYKLTEIL